MYSPSLTVERRWIPEHKIALDCWCRPHPEEFDGEWLWVHRALPVRPDSQVRCFSMTGAPV